MPNTICRDLRIDLHTKRLKSWRFVEPNGTHFLQRKSRRRKKDLYSRLIVVLRQYNNYSASQSSALVNRKVKSSKVRSHDEDLTARHLRWWLGISRLEHVSTKEIWLKSRDLTSILANGIRHKISRHPHPHFSVVKNFPISPIAVWWRADKRIV